MSRTIGMGVALAAVGCLHVAALVSDAGVGGASTSSAACLNRGPIAATASPGGTAAPPLATTGRVFVSFAWSRTVMMIDLATGERTSLPAGIADAHEVAVSPDGRWGVAADFGDHLGDYAFDGRRLAVFDLRAKKLARVIDLGEYRGPHDVVFLSPNRLVVTTQTTRNVVEVDVATGQVLGATETRGKGSHTLAVSADGRTGYTTNEPEGTISRLDLAGRRFVAKHDVGVAPVEGVATTPDGREVWLGFEDPGAVRVVDGASGALLATLPGFELPNRMAISPDGRLAAITDFRCEVVQVADVPGRRVLGPIAGLPGAGVAKILPDSRTAIVLDLDGRTLYVVDLRERRVLASHGLPARPDAAAWGP